LTIFSAADGRLYCLNNRILNNRTEKRKKKEKRQSSFGQFWAFGQF
jgi:hypothetical protein